MIIKNGKAAIVNPHQKETTVTVRGRQFNFRGQRGIVMCWVDLDCVNEVLAIKQNCHCPADSKRNQFREASEAQAQMWEGTYKR